MQAVVIAVVTSLASIVRSRLALQIVTVWRSMAVTISAVIPTITVARTALRLPP